MGLFDKIKNTVMGAANDVKNAYDQAMAMDLETLCDVMKDLKRMDPKLLGCRQALSEKCRKLTDDELEEFYAYIKKLGGIFKTHPGQETVENVLVEKNLYSRNEDGTLSKNMKFRFFK